MAKAKQSESNVGSEERWGDDVGQSRLTAGYEDNPDKPHETSIAQVEILKDSES